ncbi:phage holin family protein [Holzapfeliella sp. He02]|uniref:Phage holin family protein n=1 Tax=Holzapfeliella saturejae TaxID=3082953 RepID=A0ABU8SHF2_9LACO
MSDFILNFLQLKPYDWALTFAVAALFLEFLSGLLKALRNHTLKSSIGLLGFGKHMLIFFGFVVVFYLVVAFPTPPMNIGFGETDLGDIAAFGFCILYIFFLLVSIVENLDGAGIKLPKFLTKYLYETNDTLMNGNVKDIAKLGAKTLETAKNPTATLHNLLDEEAIEKNGNRENKDDLSTSETEQTEEPQDTKKDPQDTPDEVNKPNRLN